MSDTSPQPPLDADGVPVSVSPAEDKTLEVPSGAVPETVRSDEPTVPVQSSLEKLLRHEMLRHQSTHVDGGER